MILLKLNGEKVIGVIYDISPTYAPQENEVLVDQLPHVDIITGERVYIYYRNDKIEYQKEIER